MAGCSLLNSLLKKIAKSEKFRKARWNSLCREECVTFGQALLRKMECSWREIQGVEGYRIQTSKWESIVDFHRLISHGGHIESWGTKNFSVALMTSFSDQHGCGVAKVNRNFCLPLPTVEAKCCKPRLWAKTADNCTLTTAIDYSIDFQCNTSNFVPFRKIKKPFHRFQKSITPRSRSEMEYGPTVNLFIYFRNDSSSW